MDWITKLRLKRIHDQDDIKGSWSAENFKGNPITEAIDELIDCLSYLEMSEMKGKISSGLQNRLTFDIERILNILKLNE